MTKQPPRLPHTADRGRAVGEADCLSATADPATRMAAESMALCALPLNIMLEPDEAAALCAPLPDEDDAPDLLAEQAQVLNMLFHRLLHKGLHRPRLSGELNPAYLDAACVTLAVETQKQCRMTVESVTRLRKNQKQPEQPPEQTEEP